MGDSTAKRVCAACGREYDAQQKFCPEDGSPLRAADSVDGFVGQIIADRYRVLSTLGEGGMGRVYLAEHVRMGRQCAVKVISPALAGTDAAVARFNREAANASQINHPNVVQVYDFGEGPNGTLYLAMEYVQGETLSAIVRREGPLPMRRAATLTRQVADALTAAHHRGIVHRDLKPDNILVTRQLDGSEWVKVVDFGIAKTVRDDTTVEGRAGQTVTTVGVSIGTPEYMSPEQLSGEKLDTRTDIYSLGLVFFHLLTADLPYPYVTSREALIRRLTSPPRSLREVRPDQYWPASVQAVLDRALATELDGRYATGADFGRDLGALIAETPGESEATVRMRSADLSPPVAPTVEEGPAAARTVADRTASAPMAPAVAPPPRRRGMPIAIGLVALALAGGVYALKGTQSSPPVTDPPARADSMPQAPTTERAPIDSTPKSLAAPPAASRDTTVAASQSTATPRQAAANQPVASPPSDSARDSVPFAPPRVLQNLVPRHAFLRATGDSGHRCSCPQTLRCRCGLPRFSRRSSVTSPAGGRRSSQTAMWRRHAKNSATPRRKSPISSRFCRTIPPR